MRIAGIKLKNFKGFEGDCSMSELSNKLSDKKNVVLIGGYNGAGKTTILESLYLCFYGQLATKLYPSKGAKYENYNSLVCSLLNRKEKNKGALLSIMAVEVVLEDVKLTGNISRNISLVRTWKIEHNGKISDIIKEEFEILENGKPIEELEKSEYQDRILALLPYSVAQFFFFDGEKIEDFAADADTEFAASLKDVLGINLYSTLVADLKAVRQRILGEYNKNKEADVQLNTRRAEVESLNAKINANKIRIGDLTEDKNLKSIDLEKLQHQTSRLTRISTGNRTNIQSEKGDLEFQKETLIKDYIDTATDYLPFILSDDLCTDLNNQLDIEQSHQEWLAAQKQLEPKLDSIINSVFDDEPGPPKPDITARQKEFYIKKIEAVLKREIFNADIEKFKDFDPIHNLSGGDISKIKGLLNSFNQGVVDVLHKKAEHLKQIEISLERIRSTEVRAGDRNEDMQGLFDKITTLSGEVGSKKTEIENLIDSNQAFEKDIKNIEREITNWEGKVNLNKKQRSQIEYCEKLTNVINDFQNRFQAKRTEELEQAILEMWNKLAQKKSQVDKIKIYPERNFEVKLFDEDNEVDKTKLSAGEKEVFAISLLWALVRVSGKNYPIVIDTPFGRLDSKHRTNIVKNYFPSASEQVILLSQDEEIVGSYYKLLKPHIAKELTIEFDNRSKKSKVVEGYPFIN